jgi:methionyl-tRNA synthetase
LLGLGPVERGELKDLLAKMEAGEPLLKAGRALGEPELLFAKINNPKDDRLQKIIDRQKDKLAQILESEKSKEREPIKPEIQFDDFSKLDLRTGTILEAEKVPKTKKLIKLTVDLGSEKRTVVSGIAEFHKPEQLPGQKVVLVANLAPRKLKGIESQGMILMAENESGELGFVSAPEGWGDGFGVR